MSSLYSSVSAFSSAIESVTEQEVILAIVVLAGY